jgi:acyl dehydratase
MPHLYRSVLKYWEDYEIGEVRHTGGRTFGEADIKLHAEESGDFFPHHMDAAWCAKQPFGKRMAHGTLVLTVAIGLTADQINEASMSYGYDRVRFIKPVFIDDSIRVVATIMEKNEYKKPDHGLLVELVEVFNQLDELVMVAKHIYLVQKRQPS